ncbi:MAG: hypothetical protein IJX62_07275 [Clostridia bacterium]|nr:hypothetical protein [Clostridia bacterium]
MQTSDPSLLKEIKYIAGWCLILVALLQGTLLTVGLWAPDILLGSLLGLIAALLNLVAMAYTLQRAAGRGQETAGRILKASSALRRLLLFVICLVGGAMPCFRWWAVPIPLFFPRLAVTLRTLGKGGRPMKRERL